ncbi:phosphatidylinositol glycan anchor biosynthesis, class T precursor [Halteromyces radiatus]|uniref:phosphatidylinositol glycan anchor biosynthesis, class T precursor n=1 Tax=Halteromyces radiatus TaxID=101107 RepID=UPI00221F7430|nr:phosphatidylinositol glycan anchor biosynthesis, class T precursor [Halteromyces radiatus]KAI8079832.1 phosphatidylinositol glycan anchor biosynthesis, class T precursor [Halteromyces radiatus]
MRTLVLLSPILLSTLYLFNVTNAQQQQEERFDEQLELTTLPDGKLLAHFEFTTHVEASTTTDASILDYSLFPKVIGQVLQTYQVRDMHLTFTQGRWLYEEWGYPPLSSSGTGVELWAWMNDSGSVDKNWKSLTNVLSGLFCASLNFIDETLTNEPRLSFRPEPIKGNKDNTTTTFYNDNLNDTRLRYGALPHENVCTENLTPWIKLLPCKSKAGVATLLNAHKIYNSNFHSMSIHAASICKDQDCTERILQLKQTVTSVMDPVRETSRRDWSLSSIFDRQVSGSCPMAKTSQVKVITKEAASSYQLQPPPINTITIESTPPSFLALYDLHQVSSNEELNIRMTWPESVFEYPLELHSKPLVTAHRYFTGYGQEHGGLRITVHNDHPEEHVPVTYFDSIPWFLRLYLHSLKIQINQQGKKMDEADIIQDMFYQPGIDRSRPNVLECQLLLPPQSVVILTIDFEKVFLKYTEHRPDANRGFDVGSAVITVWDNKSHELQTRIYTDTLLVSLPTPDFSMPYNVITLTCTVIALFFGSIFNLLIRNFVMVDDKED